MKTLYQQYSFPIYQNRMYDTASEAIACPKGNIHLVEDDETGLIFNLAFQSKLMVYDKHYQNEQALSQSFQVHLHEVASIIGTNMGNQELVEIGCGKGFFLELLQRNGFEVKGFDPTYEGANPNIRRQYFGEGVLGKEQGIILRHVLEHIENPYDFLVQIRNSNGGEGLIYIEVPCFDWICKNRAWFDVYYEHVNYFRMADFERLFAEIKVGGRLFGGQYIYVVAELASLRPSKINTSDRIEFPSDFTEGILERHKSAFQGGCSIWGGASRGAIFALLLHRAGFNPNIVIDINPAKQGKHMPATGLVVVAPEVAMTILAGGSNIIMMNSNYYNEVKLMSKNAFNYIGVEYV